MPAPAIYQAIRNCLETTCRKQEFIEKENSILNLPSTFDNVNSIYEKLRKTFIIFEKSFCNEFLMNLTPNLNRKTQRGEKHDCH